jgi:hypothetical protein
MCVVVVGGREWTGEKGLSQIHELLDGLKEKYSGMIVVTNSTDKGVGKFVRERCLGDEISFLFVDS